MTNIEQRRTVHGGNDSALSVELAPVAFCSRGIAYAVGSGDEASWQGFGVYIRNPLAFHVNDFLIGNGQLEYGPPHEAKAAAWRYALALADHLGCSVDSALSRPGPADLCPLHADLSARGFEIQGGGSGPSFYCYRQPGGNVKVTALDGGEIPGAADWLVGVYSGGDPEEGHEESLIWSVGSDTGQPLARVLAGAAAFVVAVPADAPAAN